MSAARALDRIAAGLLVAGWLTPAAAAPPSAYDVASLPAPITPSAYATLESSRSLGARVLGAGARLSYLNGPLALRLPAAAAEGTTASGVEHVLLAEVLLSGGLTRHLDVGFGLPLRLFQEGFGLGAAGAREGVRSLALGDPRVLLAHAVPLFEEVPMRIYASLFVPLASRNAFAGGAAARGIFGVAASYGDVTRLGLDLSARLEETTSFGLTNMGSHARVGVGLSQELPERLRVGLELSGAFLFVDQGTPPEGAPPSVSPFEALVHLRRALEFGEVALLAGIGLPTSVSSSLTGATPTLAPGTPVLRLGIEFRYRLEPWARTSD